MGNVDTVLAGTNLSCGIHIANLDYAEGMVV
jgi:hypothetical protein